MDRAAVVLTVVPTRRRTHHTHALSSPLKKGYTSVNRAHYGNNNNYNNYNINNNIYPQTTNVNGLIECGDDVWIVPALKTNGN